MNYKHKIQNILYQFVNKTSNSSVLSETVLLSCYNITYNKLREKGIEISILSLILNLKIKILWPPKEMLFFFLIFKHFFQYNLLLL